MVSDANYTYVGGIFTSVGSYPIRYLVRIKNSDNTVDPTWTPNPSNLSGGFVNVQSLALSGSDLFGSLTMLQILG